MIDLQIFYSIEVDFNKMKKIKNITLLVLTFICVNTKSQNLVPNPSFKTYYNCSDQWQYITNAIYWKGMETPDYFNSCIMPGTIFNTSIPKNYFGFQMPKSGSAYAGLITYYVSDFREFIQAKLSQKLNINTTYCVNVNVALADTSLYAIKKLGVYLTTDTIIPPYLATTTPPYYSFTYYNPQIESNMLLSDTANWTSISGSFLSLGNEGYITIGNFRDDLSTDTTSVRNNTSYTASYYYIDDVSVEEVLNANAGNDTSLYFGDSIQIGNNQTENASYLWTPSTGLSDPTAANPMVSPVMTTTYVVTKTQCSVTTSDTVTVSYLGVGVDEKIRSQKIKIFPNPSNGNFTLESNLQNNESGWIMIYNLTGSLVGRYQITHETKTDLNTQNLSPGIYQYQVLINGFPIKKDKLIIIK
jgi:hypothetical protein